MQEPLGQYSYANEVAYREDTRRTSNPLKGFGTADTLEVVENDEGGIYRAVYTVRFADWIYVLHCFQKKSTKGIETPKADMQLIRTRLAASKMDYAAWLESQKGGVK